MSTGPPSLADLVGARAAIARERLGDPDADRPGDPGRWLIWRGDGWRVRLRTGGDAGEGARVTSWSLTWDEGRPTLRAAVEPLGLWPAARPDVRADGLEAPLARRGLAGPEGREDWSLTATARAGRFVRVAVFDEPPEW